MLVVKCFLSFFLYSLHSLVLKIKWNVNAQNPAKVLVLNYYMHFVWKQKKKIEEKVTWKIPYKRDGEKEKGIYKNRSACVCVSWIGCEVLKPEWKKISKPEESKRIVISTRIVPSLSVRFLIYSTKPHVVIYTIIHIWLLERTYMPSRIPGVFIPIYNSDYVCRN